MICVFKTSIENREQVALVKPILDELFLPQGQWNFDLEDCDRILRVAGGGLNTAQLPQALKSLGFLCEELPD